MSAAPRKRAAALAYDARDPRAAPRVVAKGYGALAERIVERAHQAGLYVHTAPEMVGLLMQVDLDAQIPPALYQAVAELLAWLYALECAPSGPPREAAPDRTDNPGFAPAVPRSRPPR